VFHDLAPGEFARGEMREFVLAVQPALLAFKRDRVRHDLFHGLLRDIRDVRGIAERGDCGGEQSKQSLFHIRKPFVLFMEERVRSICNL
jgi:hypothetical protein